MATAKILGQDHKVLKNPDEYLAIDSSIVYPFANDEDLFLEDTIDSSLLEFDENDAAKNVFAVLKSVYKKEKEVVLATISPDDEDGNPLVDPTKTKILFNPDGTFTLYNPDFEKLAEGQTADVSFTYIVKNSGAKNAKGSSVLVVREVSIEVTGTNEGPLVVEEEDFDTIEDSIFNGQLVATDIDSDDDSSTLTYILTSSDIPSGFTFNADGSYTLDTKMSEYQHLSVGGTITYFFSWQAMDSHGALSSIDSVTITITGTNDAPVVEATDLIGEVTELVAPIGSISDNGMINFSDVDLNDTHIISSVIASSGALGTLTAAVLVDTTGTGTGGVISWEYTVVSSDVEYLAKDETKVESFTLTLDDGNGSTVDRSIDVTITGTNDAPTVAVDLSSDTDEDADPYTIDLLTGAADVDNDHILNISNITEVDGKGGWSVDGNSVIINPNFYDDMNDGEFTILDLNYQVVDEHGASVDQSLIVNIEGITDAPSLNVTTSDGDRVNELRLHITSQPANTERVALSFSNLSTGVIILDQLFNNVTNGVDDYIGTEIFTVILPEDQDADLEIGVTVTGIRPDGEIIGENSLNVDLEYDVTSSTTTLTFSSQDQNMWGNFNGQIGWHEYVPFIGEVSQEWNSDTKEWDSLNVEAWSSGSFNIIDINVNNDNILQFGQGILDAAQDVFDSAAYLVDLAALTAFNVAKATLDGAYQLFLDTAYVVDTGAKAIFDAAKYAYDVTAQVIYDAAEDVWSAAQSAYQWIEDNDIWPYLATDIAKVALDIAEGIWDVAVYTFDTVATGIYNTAYNVYEGVKQGVYDVADAIYQNAVDTYNIAYYVYEEVKQSIYDVADVVFQVAQDTYDTIEEAVTSAIAGTGIEFESQLKVDADLHAQVGLQVDFDLDLGSVDTEVEYLLTSQTQYNQTTDMLAITPMMTNMTTGDSVAYSTVSPNATFYAAILYDVWADLDVEMDGYLRSWYLELNENNELVPVLGTIFDMSPNTDGINIETTVSTNSWGDLMSTLPTEYLPDLPTDLEVGKFVLVDFDSTELEPFEVPFIETLTDGMLNIEVAFPTVQTEGTEDNYTQSFFEEGAFINVDFSEISDAIFNLVNAKLDYSEEFQEMYDLDSLGDDQTLSNLVGAAIDAFLVILWDNLDGQSTAAPIFVLDATDETNTSLLHINTFSDEVMTDTLSSNTADFGFYTSYGESDPVVKVTLDVDAVIAVIVDKVVTAIATAASAGAGSALEAIPAINPLDIEFGIEEILEMVEVPEDIAEEITNYIDLSIGFEAADIDAYAQIDFSQEFSLSIDDMSYALTFENGDIEYFSASGAGDIVVDNASDYDMNGDGVIDYSLDIVPTAMFSNDTEIGLSIGYTIALLQGEFAAGVKLPLDEILGDMFPTIEIPMVDIAVGPLLTIEGDLDILDVDIFETRFDLDIGSDFVELNGVGIADSTMFIA